MESSTNNETKLVMEIKVDEKSYDFASTYDSALKEAEKELSLLDETIEENKESIKNLQPQCDKLDYTLAACLGALCGVMDVFLVGKPGESPLGDITDKWFENRTIDFAKLTGWKKSSDNGDDLSSAIAFLEKKFKIPYDQRGAGDAASFVFDLNPKNHHFKSLGHNPTILGLVFYIMDQFSNTSHFVTGGEMITLQRADDGFELHGNNVPSKLFCGFVNWFGHLISDISGSSGSKGRGMGIPSPFWAWTNDVIAIKQSLHIPVSEFNKSINEIALEIYKQGYDARFQTAQAIPVFINGTIVRLIYSVRRLIKYFSDTSMDQRSFALMWKSCEPFKNSTVKRMLTVAHGTFCLIDIGDATIRGFATGGGYFNVPEFVMRINIVGVGRFAVSLWGELKRGTEVYKVKEEAYFAERQRVVIEDYIAGLKILSSAYDDQYLLTFVDDFKSSQAYIQAFEKSTKLAEKRGIDEKKILRNKSDIDKYFGGNGRR